MYDSTAIVAPQNKGWILDRFAKEVMKGGLHNLVDGSSHVHYGHQNVPEAKTYYVTHYSLISSILVANPHISASQMVVHFTHPSVPIRSVLPHLKAVKKIIVASDEWKSYLTAYGLPADLLHIVPECADPGTFIDHERTDKPILISSAYYPRKDPDTLLRIILNSPTRKFKLLGKGWDTWQKAVDLKALANLEIIGELDYAKYPAVYSSCDVFLSCATMEGGGPNALIEAMHANLVPVVTDTGNAREYIRHGHNGFIFKQGDTDSAMKFINRAYSLDIDISLTVQEFTWQLFAQEISRFLLPSQT